jgi:peptidoglycan/LPS O-acetylase OafA/YrhL
MAQSRMGSPLLHRGGFTALAAAVGFVLLAILDTSWSLNRFLSWAPLRAVGRVSYGLYVWHPLTCAWVLSYAKHFDRPARFTIAVVVTGIVTALSWRLVEQPFLAWKDRLERRRLRITTFEPGLSTQPS